MDFLKDLALIINAHEKNANDSLLGLKKERFFFYFCIPGGIYQAKYIPVPFHGPRFAAGL
jgi:hypothetical protein